MPPASRFGASKYRNAVPHVPPRDEWYRGSLPSSTSASSSSAVTSSFSSEVKANRQWLATLNPAGDLSYRSYGAPTAQANSNKGLGTGGGVGDWDLSRLDDGTLIVGGLDGAISIHALQPASELTPALSTQHTIPSSSSPILCVSLHPTTSSVLLASSPTHPVAIYDISTSPTAPSIELSPKAEPKGLWSVTWSPDGRLVAGLGKSGTGHVWDARAGPNAIMSKALSLQAIKPARIAWIGDDLFLTSFSKTRGREYSLLSTKSSLSSSFTQSIDTNTAPLVSVIDQERRIVYLAGRGDMTLRQIELSGPMGFQETVHALPHALSSTSLALAHPSNLPVMSAQIATLLLPVVDKDGDTIMPFDIRVPRRQLIDFHEDLYPEIRSTRERFYLLSMTLADIVMVPEQSSSEWLSGGDKPPSLVSLDPARRHVWEGELADHTRLASTASTTAVPDVRHGPNTTLPAEVSTISSRMNSESATPHKSEPEKIDPPASSPSISTVDKSASDPNLPLTEDSETRSSTSYKVRVIGNHIVDQLESHRKSGGRRPLMVGLQGPQGCGKTTLCETLIASLRDAPRGIKSAVLSLDDLYRTNDGLKDLAKQHPENRLLTGRGPPGTHDIPLATSVLEAVSQINDGQSASVDLPVFDKSLCGGEGDRSPLTSKVIGPLDVFILEGWSVGFGPLPPTELETRYESASTSPKPYFANHSIDALRTLNNYLSDFAEAVYSSLDTMVSIEPETYDHVFSWRLEQERAMKAKNGGKGMTDEQVQSFVERYMPGYELWQHTVWRSSMPWLGRSLRMAFGKDRQVMKVERPSPSVKPQPTVAATQPAISVSVSTTNAAAAKPNTASVVQLPASIALTPAPSRAALAATSHTPIGSSPSSQAKPPNTNWSRKFLAGNSPLIPAYDQVPALSALHQDSLILKASPKFAFFPIQGTGGRLAVQPLQKKGRIATGGEGYLTGGVEIADFAVEPFDGQDGVRVAIAGDDGAIRVWRVSESGIIGTGPEPMAVLKSTGVDKVAQLAFHPTAHDLLTAATNDHGKGCIRFWDLSSGQAVTHVELDVSGVFNIAWSPLGDKIAVAAKDGRILVLDPRVPAAIATGKAHDSPRSFQMAWIDSQHILSAGFSRGSQRRLNLYRLPTGPSGEIETVHSLMIDVSPSVMFPQYDPDTSILYIWGKGERQIQAYEVRLENKTEPISKLPSFTSGSPQLAVAWLPKAMVNVKKVEVMRALRLTSKSIEEVIFTIPRNKPEYFQDDIYPETGDSKSPSTTAAKWLEGDNSPPVRISLQPEGMTPLSQAQQTSTPATKKFVPAADIMSEEQKKKKEMDALFARAKADESSDDEPPTTTGLDPPDDDW